MSSIEYLPRRGMLRHRRDLAAANSEEIRLRSARETRYAPRRRVHEHRSTNYLHTLSDYAERERVSSLCKFARGGNLCTTSLKCARHCAWVRPPPAAIHSSTSFSRTASGIMPLSMTTAWKSLTLNRAPSAVSARERSSRILW